MKKLAKLLPLLLMILLLCGCANVTPEAHSPEPTAAVQQDLLADAAAALKAGNYAEAIELYRAADAQNPQDLTALNGLIDACTQGIAAGGDYRADLISAYEMLYSADAFTETEYLELAALYIEAGEFVKARDLLEKGQCLMSTAEKDALLTTFVTDLATDSESVQQAFTPVADRLFADDAAGAVDLLLAEDLFPLLCSRLPGGARRYTLTDAGSGATIKMLVSRDAGEPVLRIWLVRTDSQVIAIRLTAGALSVVEAETQGGSFNGAFRSSYFKADNSSIVIDAGTFRNNICTGELTSQIYTGVGESTLLLLWSGRDAVEMTSYTGTIDENGHATAAEPKGIEDGRLAYAYTENKKQYAFILLPDGQTAENYTFDYNSFGIEMLPDW